MNDFTKEELEDLLEWGNTYCIDRPMIAKMHHSNLLGKIQAMIDNYCEYEQMTTSDMKNYQAICIFNENGKTYFTLPSDIFAFGQLAALDIAHKIICSLSLSDNHFSNEWIDRIIVRLQELKNE